MIFHLLKTIPLCLSEFCLSHDVTRALCRCCQNVKIHLCKVKKGVQTPKKHLKCKRGADELYDRLLSHKSRKFVLMSTSPYSAFFHQVVKLFLQRGHLFYLQHQNLNWIKLQFNPLSILSLLENRLLQHLLRFPIEMQAQAWALALSRTPAWLPRSLHVSSLKDRQVFYQSRRSP